MPLVHPIILGYYLANVLNFKTLKLSDSKTINFSLNDLSFDLQIVLHENSKTEVLEVLNKVSRYLNFTVAQTVSLINIDLRSLVAYEFSRWVQPHLAQVYKKFKDKDSFNFFLHRNFTQQDYVFCFMYHYITYDLEADDKIAVRFKHRPEQVIGYLDLEKFREIDNCSIELIQEVFISTDDNETLVNIAVDLDLAKNYNYF